MGISRYHLSVVTFLMVWVTACNVLLTAAKPFEFIGGNVSHDEIHVGYGDDFVINCTTNDPNATTFLYRRLHYPPNGEEFKWKLLLPKPNKIIRNGQVVTVKSFGNNDIGDYWCNATNRSGSAIQWSSDEYITTMAVDKEKILNSIKVQPKSAMTLVGSSITIKCSADSGYLKSILQWEVLRNGSYVAVSKDLVTDGKEKSLINLNVIMKNVRVSDSGLYRCLLIYEGNERHKEVRLTVSDYKAPVIKWHSGRSAGAVEVRSSDKTSIYCIAEGHPLPTIQWYKNGSKIKLSECNDTKSKPCKSDTKYWASVLSYNKTLNATLTIKNVFPDDHGSYTCIAYNTKSIANATIVLLVLTSPQIRNQNHRQMKVDLGTSINETCSATGNPLPDVVWTRTDDPDREVLASGKGKAFLVVKNVQKNDFGNYTCNATNNIMNTVKSVTAVFTIKEKQEKFLTLVRKEVPESMVIGIICGTVVFICIVAVICFILYRRQKKRTKEYKLLYFMKMGNPNCVIDPDRSLLEQCNSLPYDLDWEFPEERLILGEPLGSGAFGQVLKAEAIGMPAFKPREKTGEARRLRSKVQSPRRKCKDGQNSLLTTKETVAVKTLLEGAGESEYKDLASELKILIHLGEHKNIVNVLGACTRGRRLLVIIEYAPYGNLLSFLRARRDIYDPNWVKTSNNPEQEFTLVNLIVVAYQISRGMEFLASKKCVHRDLAARNVLVGENYVMKISDFGLARDIYQDDLYVKTTSGLLPVKWMALESLFDRVYTEKSDVWSFGIVLWEVFTLGGCPYPSIPVEELFNFLNSESRMEPPTHCPNEMYDIMIDCWRRIPDERPTFAELTARIKRIIEKNAPKCYPCLESEPHEPTRASNEYLTSAESIPSAARKTYSLANQATRAPNSDDSSKNSTSSAANFLIAEPEENSNSFFDNGEKEEKKPFLPQPSFSSSKQKAYINQHESAV